MRSGTRRAARLRVDSICEEGGSGEQGPCAEAEFVEIGEWYAARHLCRLSGEVEGRGIESVHTSPSRSAAGKRRRSGPCDLKFRQMWLY